MTSSSFKTLDHIESYPIVHSAIETFKANPYGAKSIDLTHTGYARFVSPFAPYAAGPYRYVAPYIGKADQLACSSLDRVDQTFPLVKADPQALKSHALGLALFPLQTAIETKEYLFRTYDSEYRKCGGQGYGSGSKAIITTSMVVVGDSLNWLARFLSVKKQEGSRVVQRGRDFVGEKSAEAVRFAQQKESEVRRLAYRADISA